MLQYSRLHGCHAGFNRQQRWPAGVRTLQPPVCQAVIAEGTRQQKVLNFPFVKIAGQEEMKLALLLNVVDPNIGGVLVMGDRGTGKSVAVSIARKHNLTNAGHHWVCPAHARSTAPDMDCMCVAPAEIVAICVTSYCVVWLWARNHVHCMHVLQCSML